MSDSFFPSPFEETYSGSGYLEQGCRKMQVMVQKQQVSGVSKQKDSLSFMLLVHHGSACWLCSTQFSLQTRQLEESQVGTLLMVVTGERRSEIRRVSCQQSNSPLMSQTFNMVPPATHLAVQEMQESWVRSLGQEDPLEQKMITHSSILAWEIPWTEELGGLPSMGSQRVRHD